MVSSRTCRRFQASLLDQVPTGTDGAAPGATGVRVGELGDRVQRTELGSGAWIDLRPDWIQGSDELFLRLADDVPWQAERRRMYDRVLDVPRLVRFYRTGEALPDAVLVEAREALSRHYAGELGEPFTSAGMCLYRDGDDSVAWHGDRLGRGSTTDTMVAIVSFGSPRRLSLRPRGGGRQRGYTVGHGDLLVMGGSCQRTWEHAVLKTARPVGPRISVQFRPAGVG
ncbi:alpha-ketoglutarate-dependent dioxygenase AlkB [Dermatobacter hominis]|uniref:alpha-ketoglutarate-dependent dioxygenase AlkB n=1 Tax=Dermatobacter hominis TaxID=2884263 RepID=UPI001D12E6D6|nr:alpha-ketoglutarate-dependent dioxygenase AlkB [Dermatobacter hominis]UDY37809.1 alpha-ketoglutarate-dependent dioxygenase AlkB [Dermatobacter hominis]